MVWRASAAALRGQRLPSAPPSTGRLHPGEQQTCDVIIMRPGTKHVGKTQDAGHSQDSLAGPYMISSP